MLLIQGNDDLAVGVGLEGVGFGEVLAQDLVVVDFAVDGEGDGLIVAEDGLGAGLCMSG